MVVMLVVHCVAAMVVLMFLMVEVGICTIADAFVVAVCFVMVVVAGVLLVFLPFVLACSRCVGEGLPSSRGRCVACVLLK